MCIFACEGVFLFLTNEQIITFLQGVPPNGTPFSYLCTVNYKTVVQMERKETKKMDLLIAIEQIVEKAKDSQLSKY